MHSTHMIFLKEKDIGNFSFHILHSKVIFLTGGGGGALIYQSDVQVPPSTSDIGVFP